TVYASSSGGVFVTTSHGSLWTQCGSPTTVIAATDLQVDRVNPRTLYTTLGFFSTNGNIFMSTDGCASWTSISGNLPGMPVYSLQADPSGILFVGADDGVYESRDRGASWSRFGTGLPRVRVRQIELN